MRGYDPDSYSGSGVATDGNSHAGQLISQTKRDTLVLQLRGWAWGSNPLVKKNNTNTKIQREGQVPHKDVEPMEEKGEEEEEEKKILTFVPNFVFIIFVFFFP